MSLFAKAAGLLGSGKKVVKKDHLQAACAYSALIMHAKPPVTDEEFDRAMTVMNATDKLSAFSSSEKEELLATYCEKLKVSGRVNRPLLRKEIRDIAARGNKEDCENILLIAIEVADDSEGISDEELAMLRLVAKEDLGLDADKYI